MDAHGSDVSPAEAVAARRMAARSLFDVEMLEKIALVVGAYVVVLPFVNGAIDVPATLFSVLLLTLLVTMYDRFRPYYQVRRNRAAERLERPRPSSAS